MLLHIQKLGLSYAARPQDWRNRFKRYPKRHARPLLVLRNFGPVDFVYDILDTEGEPLPDSAFAFPTAGNVPLGWITARKHHPDAGGTAEAFQKISAAKDRAIATLKGKRL